MNIQKIPPTTENTQETQQMHPDMYYMEALHTPIQEDSKNFQLVEENPNKRRKLALDGNSSETKGDCYPEIVQVDEEIPNQLSKCAFDANSTQEGDYIEIVQGEEEINCNISRSALYGNSLETQGGDYSKIVQVEGEIPDKMSKLALNGNSSETIPGANINWVKDISISTPPTNYSENKPETSEIFKITGVNSKKSGAAKRKNKSQLGAVCGMQSQNHLLPNHTMNSGGSLPLMMSKKKKKKLSQGHNNNNTNQPKSPGNAGSKNKMNPTGTVKLTKAERSYMCRMQEAELNASVMRKHAAGYHLTKGEKKRLKKILEAKQNAAVTHENANSRHSTNPLCSSTTQTGNAYTGFCQLPVSNSDVLNHQERALPGSSTSRQWYPGLTDQTKSSAPIHTNQRLIYPEQSSSASRQWYPGLKEQMKSSAPIYTNQRLIFLEQNNNMPVMKPAEVTSHDLQVTIIPEGYPNIMLNEEQAGMIRNALLAKLDTLPPGVAGPKFSGMDLINGAIVVLCLDAYTQRWLKHVVEICSPRRGLKLMVSKPVIAVTWVPGPSEDPKVILRRLRTQNNGLCTETWKIIQRRVEDTGQELTVLMEETDWKRIEEMECMPHVNFSRILFTALQ